MDHIQGTIFVVPTINLMGLYPLVPDGFLMPLRRENTI